MKEKIRALIVDDEQRVRRRVRKLLDADPEVELVGECADGRAAIAAIQAHRPDLVFLDVEMPRIDGFDVLAQIGPGRMPLVVFVTAHGQYAVRAFEVHAVDYLLKPYTDARFQEALRQAKHRLQTEHDDEINARTSALLAALRNDYLERLIVKTNAAALIIKVAAIDWIEAEDKYVRLHVGTESYLLRETISNLEGRLDPKRFHRIHRSSIVNLDRIQKLETWFHHEYQVVLRDGTKLVMSRSQRKRLGEKLGWEL
jgi:two-component system, LytTR family, response regulator